MLFDWQNPNYLEVFADRRRRLARLRSDPTMLGTLKKLYANEPALWCEHWGITLDPRNIERGIPALTPFKLMPFQVDWFAFTLENWRQGKYVLTEKGREMGLSWCAVHFAAWLTTMHRGAAVGFGSSKLEGVDVIGNPKSLLEKVRIVFRYLPREFRAGWTEADGKYLAIRVPDTQSIIVGEGGTDIGRGDRTSLYFVDEAEHLANAQSVDLSLSGTTNARHDISSVKGFANPMAIKVQEGKHPVFKCRWQQDLRKSEKWHQEQIDKYGLDVVLAEFDGDRYAGRAGQVIKAQHVKASLDLHKKLGLTPTGRSFGGMDLSGGGVDLTAFAARRGPLLTHLSAWKPTQMKDSILRAHRVMDSLGIKQFLYDSVGVGYACGEISDNICIAHRAGRHIKAIPFGGGEAVVNPTKNFPGSQIKNEDMLANRKAQVWWYGAHAFENSFRLANGDTSVSPDDCIFIDTDGVDDVESLVSELSQATYTTNLAGKIVIEKSPEGSRSPNRADSLLIVFAPQKYPMVTGALLRAAQAAPLAPGSFTAQLGHLRF
jgi:phage terminase large subunit